MSLRLWQKHTDQILITTWVAEIQAILHEFLNRAVRSDNPTRKLPLNDQLRNLKVSVSFSRTPLGGYGGIQHRSQGVATVSAQASGQGVLEVGLGGEQFAANNRAGELQCAHGQPLIREVWRIFRLYA